MKVALHDFANRNWLQAAQFGKMIAFRVSPQYEEAGSRQLRGAQAMSITIEFDQSPNYQAGEAQVQAGFRFVPESIGQWVPGDPGMVVIGGAFRPAFETTAIDGRAFDFVSLQLNAQWEIVKYCQFDTENVAIFTGTRGDGTQVKARYLVPMDVGTVTYVAEGFHNLEKLEVVTGAYFGSLVLAPPPSPIVKFGQGFPTDAGIPWVYAEQGLSFYNSADNRWAGLGNGLVGPPHMAGPTTIKVVPIAGGTFDFLSVRLANTDSGRAAQTIAFTGQRLDGTLISGSFDMPGFDTAPQSYEPRGFLGLASLTFAADGVAFGDFAFLPNPGETLPPASASVARTMRFDRAFPTSTSAPTSYAEAGLRISNSTGNQWVSPCVAGFARTYIMPSTLVVTPEAAGATFDFRSLQFCNASIEDAEQPVTFTGTRPDGTTVTASFTARGNDIAPQTFAPPGFDGLASLSVEPGWMAFGNLVFATDS
jgi:hypothetical protein